MIITINKYKSLREKFVADSVADTKKTLDYQGF